MRHRGAAATAAVALGVALAACTSGPTSPAASATEAASLGPAASSTEPGPGLAYTGAEVLEAMRGSRRPGGVPDEVERPEVAEAVAAELWTHDGQPWEAWTVGGSCGPAGCTLEVAGTPGGAEGSDLYSFRIDPATATVTLEAHDLHGLAAAMREELDAAARTVVPAGALADLALVDARWLPPPEEGRYWLAYRSGGEEGAPGVDLLIDLAGPEVLESVTRP